MECLKGFHSSEEKSQVFKMKVPKHMENLLWAITIPLLDVGSLSKMALYPPLNIVPGH